MKNEFMIIFVSLLLFCSCQDEANLTLYWQRHPLYKILESRMLKLLSFFHTFNLFLLFHKFLFSNWQLPQSCKCGKFQNVKFVKLDADMSSQIYFMKVQRVPRAKSRCLDFKNHYRGRRTYNNVTSAPPGSKGSN